MRCSNPVSATVAPATLFTQLGAEKEVGRGQHRHQQLADGRGAVGATRAGALVLIDQTLGLGAGQIAPVSLAREAVDEVTDTGAAGAACARQGASLAGSAAAALDIW